MTDLTRKLVSTMVVLAVAVLPAVADDYDLDASHFAALFKVSHLGFSNTYGMIPDASGSFSFDPEKPESNALEVVVKTESINTHHEGRDKHLRGPDFFDTKQFPEMRFKSTTWEKTGDNTYAVTGDFTLLGTTKEITLDVAHLGSGEMRGDYRTGFETTFSILRSDYGMNYGLPGVGDEVTITISFEGVRK